MIETQSFLENLEIIVIANKRKKCLTTECLKGIKHSVFYTCDYNLPPEIKFTNDWVADSKVFLGAYRCFKGHQDALKTTKKNNVLVLEDDAIPKVANWLNIVKDSIPLIEAFTFDVVSLHSRLFKPNLCKSFMYNNIEFLMPDRKNLLERGKDLHLHNSKFFCVGSLAYLVNRANIPKIIEHKFNGVPMDIFLWKEFSFCFIKETPFIHDRREGSLVEDNL